MGKRGNPNWKKGVSDNPKGRPTGTTRTNLLMDAIAKVEKQKGKKKFLIHAVEQAYTDTKVLVAILKKIIPDLKAVEITGQEGGTINITVTKE